jgi:ELWxxDGT repeat protein
MVKDLAPSAMGLSLSSGLYKTGANAIFVAYDKEHGVELWKSDGTKSGTGLLKDLLPGNYSSYPRHVQVIGGKAYFVGYTPDGQELFETDGTAGGTKMLTDFIASQKSVTDILPLDDNRYFLVVKNGDDSNSLYLYTVATAAKQELVNFGFNDYHYPFRPTLSITTGDNLYFITEGVGSEFWKSDGTAGGTVKVDAFRQITELVAAGDKIFCIDQEYPSERRFLKQTDGAAGGAVTLKEVNKNLGSYALFAYGNKVVFEDQDASNGREIWISDGTASNTRLLKDVNEGPLSSFENTQFCLYNDGLYFTATNTTDGSELWKTDGTTAGTAMVADILPGPGDSKPYSLAATGGRLYFTAYTPQTGFEVWSTDGTSNAKLEMDVNRGPTYSNPRGYMDLNGTLLFFATTESSGVQLWSSAINTGIAEAGANTLSVYPNPSAGIFNVSLRNLDGASLAVFNTAGQRVHTQETATGLSQVDLGNLPSGLYVLQCTKDNKQYTTKVIKTN